MGEGRKMYGVADGARVEARENGSGCDDAPLRACPRCGCQHLERAVSRSIGRACVIVTRCRHCGAMI